jgi:hypothetical protein
LPRPLRCGQRHVEKLFGLWPRLGYIFLGEPKLHETRFE